MNTILESCVLFELDVGENKLDIGVCVIGINLRLIDNVEKFVLKQLFLQFSEPKADTSHRGRVVGYCKL